MTEFRSISAGQPISRFRWVSFRIAIWMLRPLATVQAVLLIMQPIVIGQYLFGRFALLSTHGSVAGVLMLVAGVLVPVCVVYSVTGRRLWPAIFAPVFGFAIVFQSGMGHLVRLDIHVPLGVAVVAVGVLVAAWSWTSAAGRLRRRRSSPIERDAERLAEDGRALVSASQVGEE